MKPQVGDIVQVKEEHWSTIGLHFGLVTRRVQWPEDCEAAQGRPLIDCVIFQDPNLINPMQLEARHVEVVSKAAR